MNIIITGEHCFLGSNLARELNRFKNFQQMGRKFKLVF
jgi:hypothetical protein